jgi:hypothetical protein
MHKPTTWEEVESLTRELLALEKVAHTSPQAYVKSCIEEQLAEAHERRHWRTIAEESPATRAGWLGGLHRSHQSSGY